jgi:uncharacterized membrane protein YccC
MPHLKEHFENTIKLTPAPVPISHMVLCSITVIFPLIVGFNLNQLHFAIFGSLSALALSLNDHFGPLKKRITHLLITQVFLIAAFYLGAVLEGYYYLMGILIFSISFLLGKTKNHGVELERILVFSTLQILAASGIEGTHDIFPQILSYFILSLINYLLCLLLIQYFFQNRSELISSKRQIFTKVINQHESTRFALFFSFTVTAAYFLANYLHISRGYWVVGTTVLVMLPDSTQSFYKSAQRLIGTFLGVIIGAFFIQLNYSSTGLIFFCLMASSMTPLGLSRNYWIGNIFIAALVLFLLELSNPNPLESIDLAILRVTDIAIGCLFGVLGTLLNKYSKHFSMVKKIK